MIRIGGVVVVTVAAFLVCCTADPHQEQDVAGEHAGDRYDVNEHKTRNLDSVGGNLVREVREAHQAGPTNYLQRHLDYNSPYGARWPSELAGYYAEKRNFDEIDRSPLNTFVRKRNFDEIDQTAMPFPYAIKRFYHFYSPNYPPVSRLDQKRYRPDFPMDEIDLSGFPIGSKRSSDSYPLAARLR